MTICNVLISGANGFVGACLADRLASQGCRVVGIIKDRNFKTRRDVLEKISVVYGDIRDLDVVRYAISHYEIEAIFHLGAVTILKQSNNDPSTCYSTNVIGTVNILEAARQMGVKKIVVASSDKAYGTYEQLPYIETMPVQASPDPYSTSKACTDLIAQQYATGYGVDISIMRAGNIYGEYDFNMSRLMPRSIFRCFDGRPPVLYRGVAQYKREFMYIDDVIDAYLCVADRGLPGEAYNVGGSGFQSILDTTKKIIELTGNTFEPEIRDADFVEIKEQYLDSSKIEALGWKCKYQIDEGLKKTVDGYRKFKTDRSMFFYGNDDKKQVQP